jgi:hypothetical protein
MAPAKRDLVAQDLGELSEGLKRLWVTLTTDPKKQRRKERAWGLLFGATSAVFTLAARRSLAKAWPVLTGEEPPIRAAKDPEEVAEPDHPEPRAQDWPEPTLPASLETPPVTEASAPTAASPGGEPG